MKKSSIFYAFVLVLVLSVYYFDYYKGEEKEKKKDEASILIPFPKDQIIKIELNKGGEEVEVVRDDKSWNLKKPIQDLADETTMDDWLNSLTSEKNTESIGEGETVNWNNYGLEKPKASITVYKNGGEKIQIDLATRKNFEGSSFLRKDQGKLVMVASASWYSLMDKNILGLRDKRVLRKPTTDLQEVYFKRGKELLRLEVKEGLWVINGLTDFKFAQNAVRDLVNAIGEMRATEFATEVTPNDKQKIEMSLTAPQVIAELKFKDGKTWTAEFGVGKDNQWYAWPKDQDKVLKVEKIQIEKITKATVDSLRDREVPFVFKKDEVKKIIVQNAKAPEKSMELAKEGDKWKSSLAGEVDEKVIIDLVDKLSQMRVNDFLDGKGKATGIEPPLQKITLADQEGKTIWSAAIGESYKKKVDKSESKFYFVKTSAYEDVVTVAENSVSALDFSKIIKVDSAKDKPEKDKSEKDRPTETQDNSLDSEK
jgi:hypothetical protein